MIKSTNELNNGKIYYPKLMISTNMKQLVLFITEGEGILLDKGLSTSDEVNASIGHIESWDMDRFIDYNEEVTIKNA